VAKHPLHGALIARMLIEQKLAGNVAKEVRVQVDSRALPYRAGDLIRKVATCFALPSRPGNSQALVPATRRGRNRSR
jgi:hypothetical protein